jgi:hypothetical protein
VPRSSSSKGWATRRANAAFAARSVAAKKGWATRRRNNAKEIARQILKRPGGKNKKRGKVAPYKLQKFGMTFEGARYDFRGLSKSKGEINKMRDLVLRDAVGHYARLLIATTSEAAYRRLTTSTGSAMVNHVKRQDPNRRYFFWTPEIFIESTMEMYEAITAQFDGQLEVGEVKIVLVEIL